MTIKGSLLLNVPIVKQFSAENFQSPTKIGPQNGGFSQKWGSKYYFLFSKPQKAHHCVGPRMYFAWRSVLGSGLYLFEEPKKRTFTHMGRKNPWPDLHKILHWGDIQNVITDANLGDDQFNRFCACKGVLSTLQARRERCILRGCRTGQSLHSPAERTCSRYFASYKWNDSLVQV